MTGGYQALTEKEKETLRLLLGGHDAKSIARTLDLSVHTINERLRDCRRKMAASSSREAARQLHEIESKAPQLLGDKALGDAPIADQPHLSDQPSRARTGRRAGWIIGGIIMSVVLALAALASFSGASFPGAAPEPQAAAPSAAVAAENATVEAARAWLTLTDKSDWQASWNATGAAFRKLNTSARWAQVSSHVRAPLGAVQERELATVNFAPAPPYGYWLVKFRTSFAGKADAVETLSLAWDNGAWRVVGYTIE